MKFDTLKHILSPELRKALITWGNRLLLVGVFAYMIVQLSGVGWEEIVNNLPTQPLFYLLFIGGYLGLPLAETFIYRILWGLPFRVSFPQLLKKRVYNKEVMNYSGEAHLYFWARNHVDRPGRRLLLDMKDNTIISSLTSMSVAVTLLVIFLLTGLLPFEALFREMERTWIIGGALCLVMLILLGIRFRRSVISLPARSAFALFFIHLSRLLFVKTLRVLQWMVVMPAVPITAWFSLLSLEIVMNQIPLLPSKEFLVVGASTELSNWLSISEAAVASMLLVTAVLDKIVNVILFAYLSTRKDQPQPDEQAALDAWNKEQFPIKNP